MAQQNSLTMPVQLLFGKDYSNAVLLRLGTGVCRLYQFNVMVPNVPTNNVEPFSFTLGGYRGYSRTH